MYRDSRLSVQVAQTQTLHRASLDRWKARHFAPATPTDPRLSAVIRSAKELPTYAALYADSSDAIDAVINGSASDPSAALRALPLVDKETARSITSDALHERREHFSHYFETSGTTSRPMATPKGPFDIATTTVTFGENWSEIIEAGSTALILINSPQGPAAFQFERALNYLGLLTFRTWVDTYRNDYDRVLDTIENLRPDVVAGPPSQVLNLYQRASDAGRAAPTFRSVLLLGERSTPGLKRRLAELSRGRVHDAAYGSSETGTLAVAASPGLRLQTHGFLFEIRDRSTGLLSLVSDQDDCAGELIVTPLDLLLRPLIRYDTGDVVRITRAPSGEHLVTPLGRACDATPLPDVAIDQQECEDLLWPIGERSPVLNYMFVARDDGNALLVTSTEGTSWESSPVGRAIRERLSGIALVTCDHLPAISGLGSALGWKASRFLDLRCTAESGPAGLTESLRSAARRQVDALVSGDVD
ncbi:AMP-binding protein [Rathayibacter rathayi]|uniref:AMP-binding protein n=2 Tax=Rathayibacter rathayi TaxID=33887 RepID=UPI000BC4C623|nr:AMP-binding protein [Rathayibacter rathayi]TWD69480.1 phenylacetate-CoA ligase [Rathayibacter rathayi]SOE02373.1 phenylacetate-CoA ligase [Rathayibacter rathayi] [Rathayibacter rathayi NCPPB 2980 = VKM Ac-1601]